MAIDGDRDLAWQFGPFISRSRGLLKRDWIKEPRIEDEGHDHGRCRPGGEWKEAHEAMLLRLLTANG
jgi:hypothetical protein